MSPKSVGSVMKLKPLGVVQCSTGLLQLLKDNISPRRRPRRVHDLEAGRPNVSHWDLVFSHQLSYRLERPLNHFHKYEMPRRRCDGPLGKLNPARYDDPSRAVVARAANRGRKSQLRLPLRLWMTTLEKPNGSKQTINESVLVPVCDELPSSLLWLTTVWLIV